MIRRFPGTKQIAQVSHQPKTGVTVDGALNSSDILFREIAKGAADSILPVVNLMNCRQLGRCKGFDVLVPPFAMEKVGQARSVVQGTNLCLTIVYRGLIRDTRGDNTLE